MNVDSSLVLMPLMPGAWAMVAAYVATAVGRWTILTHGDTGCPGLFQGSLSEPPGGLGQVAGGALGPQQSGAGISHSPDLLAWLPQPPASTDPKVQPARHVAPWGQPCSTEPWTRGGRSLQGTPDVMRLQPTARPLLGAILDPAARWVLWQCTWQGPGFQAPA